MCNYVSVLDNYFYHMHGKYHLIFRQINNDTFPQDVLFFTRHSKNQRPLKKKKKKKILFYTSLTNLQII